MFQSIGYLICATLALFLVNTVDAGVNLNEPNITIGGINNRTYVVPW